MKKIFFLFFCLGSFFFSNIIFAQVENREIQNEIKAGSERGKIIITEKSDYSVYKNNKYLGLTSRESKMYLNEKSSGNFFEYIGEAFVFQKTKHNQKQIASAIDAVLEIQFSLDLNKLKKIHTQEDTETQVQEDSTNYYQPQKFLKDSGYPLFRNFPVLPKRKFTTQDTGKKWEGKSTVVVQPISKKPATRIPVFVEFEYRGLTRYYGQVVHHIKAQFGLRYKGTDKLGDIELNCSQGRRKVDIYLNLNNKPIFIREKIEEEFFYDDGSKIKHKGFLLHFYSYRGFTESFEKDSLKSYNLKTVLSNTSKNGIDVSMKKIKPTKNFDVIKTKRGTVLNLKTLNFVADKAILLDGETEKLKKIADILKNIDDGFFLVEGHTADIGNPKEQKQLSIKRAKTVTNKLIKLGISADKIIYSGMGGEKPITTNETEKGRVKNRRVEITIF